MLSKKVILLPQIALTLMAVLPFKALSGENVIHIRTLASSCATCHGTQGKTDAIVPGLAGLDETYFIRKMHAYRNSDHEHEVMVQHAKGLTEEEIRQLASFFAQQSRACPYYQKHQAPVMELLEE